MVDIYAVLAQEIIIRAFRDYQKGDIAVRTDVREWCGDSLGTVVWCASALEIPVDKLQKRLMVRLTQIEEKGTFL